MAYALCKNTDFAERMARTYFLMKSVSFTRMYNSKKIFTDEI